MWHTTTAHKQALKICKDHFALLQLFSSFLRLALLLLFILLHKRTAKTYRLAWLSRAGKQTKPTKQPTHMSALPFCDQRMPTRSSAVTSGGKKNERLNVSIEHNASYHTP